MIRGWALPLLTALACVAAGSTHSNARVIEPAQAASVPALVSLRLPMIAGDRVIPTAIPVPRSVTIAAVGDVSLARGLIPLMAAEGPDYPFRLVAEPLRADLTFANLEGALTERGTPWRKGFTFRTPPSLAGGLAAAGFDVVSVANNHSMDFGEEGLADTITTLDALRIEHPGAGSNTVIANEPAILTRNGIRVAFLGFVATPQESGGFRIGAWAAGPSRTGVAVGTRESVSAAVAAARGMADFVIVAIHAGEEYSNVPNVVQRELAEAALAAGADVVLGAHPHVLQPVELRGTQLIAWSLGNFVFDLDADDLSHIPVPRVSVVLRITLTEGAGVSAVEAVPVTLDESEDRPRPATPAEEALAHALLGR